VRTQHGHTGAVEVNLAARFVQFQEVVLPIFPVPDVLLAEFVAGLE
jgi:hypothetical protein